MLALWAYIAGIAMLIGTTVYNSILMYRWMRLCALQERIVIQAFMDRHLPIWLPWSVAYGREISFQINRTGEKPTP